LTSFSRDVFNALLPEGYIWEIAPDEDLDNLFEGLSDNSEELALFLAALGFLRSPEYTPILSDLEKEYGVQYNASLTEQERRERLLAVKTARSGFGADFMQEKLREAGFDLFVHINNPPVDPGLFLFEAYNIFCNDQVYAFCGNENAVSGGLDGELVVNQDFFKETLPYEVLCNSDQAFSGNEDALCGQIDNDGVIRVPVEYTIPADPGYWPLFFFVGGVATRDTVTGEILTIEPASITVSRREELRRLIIQYKPSHSWGVLIINYI